VGYQGLSVRLRIHCQLATKGKAIQTGTPRAPARCGVEVSEEMMRSRFFMIAAVSMKAPFAESISSPGQWIGRSMAADNS